MRDRRRAPRLLCSDLLTMQVPSGARRREVLAILEDLSASGACVQVDEPLPEGEEVTLVTADNHRIPAEVRHCHLAGPLGYFVGVRFTGGWKWSQELYRPPHILDLEELLAQFVSEGLTRSLLQL